MQGRFKIFLICSGGLLIAAVFASGFQFSLGREIQRDFYVAVISPQENRLPRWPR